MLINAQSREELRIAVLSDSTLENYQVEVAEGGLSRGNIYRGVISNLQSALNAAFVDYGVARNGFLAIQDVVPEARYKEPPHGRRAQIGDVLEKSKPIVVQVLREPEGQKGAALTTNLSLAGRYLVLTPFDDTRGVSRKVEDDDTRAALKEIVGKLELPPGCGVIVRTNALDQTRRAARDSPPSAGLEGIQNEAMRARACALQRPGPAAARARSNLFRGLVDESTFAGEHYLQARLPRGKMRLVHYRERMPSLALRGGASDRAIYERGALKAAARSCQQTEALVAIGVNSGRSTEGANRERRRSIPASGDARSGAPAAAARSQRAGGGRFIGMRNLKGARRWKKGCARR
jgi:ribonuclease E